MKLLIAGFFIFCIGWFVSFQYDPYNVCRDHSEPEMKKEYYECEPLGFAIKKGSLLERPPEDRFVWEKRGQYIIEDGTKQNKDKEIQRKKAECSQYHNILDSENWEEEIDNVPAHCLDSLENLEL